MIDVVVHDVDEIQLRCFCFKVVISFKVMINHVIYKKKKTLDKNRNQF